MSAAQRANRYLGLPPADLGDFAAAKYWNPVMAPLAAPIQAAVCAGPLAGPLLAPLEQAVAEVQEGTGPIVNGYCLRPEGAMHLALAMPMPGVTPRMVDWWFGWHSDDPRRYKLWHPQAHVHAQWCRSSPSDTFASARGRDRYVGRTSCVDEYVGGKLGSFAIRFIPPGSVGLDAARLADPDRATAVCARVGFADLPFDIGYLIHYVEKTAEGSVMRSRFWIGGPNAAPRRGGWLGRLALAVAKLVLRPRAADAEGLLVHCAQEMSHLATFLPELYGEMGEE